MNLPGTITAANTNGTVDPPSAGSFVRIPTNDGANSVAIEIDGTWSATLALWQVINGKVTVIPQSSITKVADGSTGIGSGATGIWNVTVIGGGSLLLVATAFVSGQINVYLSVGQGGGGGGSGGGGGAVSIANGADVAKGSTTDPPATDNTSAWSIESLLKAVYRRLVLAPAATWTRLANTTPYSIGQTMGPSAAAGSCPALQFQVAKASDTQAEIYGFLCIKSTTNITNATFKLWLYSADPGIVNGDGGSFLPTTVVNYIGSATVTQWNVGADGAAGIALPDNGALINAILASGRIVFGYQAAGDAYVPGSAETFTWKAIARPS